MAYQTNNYVYKTYICYTLKSSMCVFANKNMEEDFT